MHRLLFISGHELVAYDWAGGFTRCDTFTADDEGLEAFRRWLRERPRAPLHVLVDLVEEEFHIDEVPHVLGRERSELYARTLDKQFRSTPHRYIARQRRLTTGRRDDQVILAGITRPQSVKPWLDAIDAAGVPLVGMHSLALVGEDLVRALGFRRGRVLLVSENSPGLLRQSFYVDGQLQFARLVPMAVEAENPSGDAVAAEVQQTLRFLVSQRLQPRDAPLAVAIVAPGADDPAYTGALTREPGVTYHCLSPAALAPQLGLKSPLPRHTADPLFGHLLLRRRRRHGNHYAGEHQRRHHYTRLARRTLQALAAGFVAAALGVGGWAVARHEARALAIDEAEARTRAFEARYTDRLQGLDDFDYRATDVKDAVDLLDRLAFVRRLGPEDAMARLGGVIEDHDRILLQGLDWRVVPQAQRNGDPGRGLSAPDPVPAGTTQADELAQRVLVRGDVVGFDGVYRDAIEGFNAFVDALRAAPGVDEVTIVQAPFDLDPDTSVSGNSGTAASADAPRRAEFVVAATLTGGADESD